MRGRDTVDVTDAALELEGVDGTISIAMVDYKQFLADRHTLLAKLDVAMARLDWQRENLSTNYNAIIADLQRKLDQQAEQMRGKVVLTVEQLLAWRASLVYTRTHHYSTDFGGYCWCIKERKDGTSSHDEGCYRIKVSYDELDNAITEAQRQTGGKG